MTKNPHRARGDARARASWSRSGFTLIEIMLAVLIIVIGLVGIIAMQIVAIQANSSARDLTEATNVGEHFLNLMQQDGSRWVDTNDLTSTQFLNVIDGQEDVWLVASVEPVNVLGVPRSALPAKGQGRAKYCVAYKLNWAVDNAVISGFVRVFWPRIAGTDLLPGCGTAAGAPITPAMLDTPAGSAGVAMVTLPLHVQRTQVD